jgi:hypothetical protein
MPQLDLHRDGQLWLDSAPLEVGAGIGSELVTRHGVTYHLPTAEEVRSQLPA